MHGQTSVVITLHRMERVLGEGFVEVLSTPPCLLAIVWPCRSRRRNKVEAYLQYGHTSDQ